MKRIWHLVCNIDLRREVIHIVEWLIIGELIMIMVLFNTMEIFQSAASRQIFIDRFTSELYSVLSWLDYIQEHAHCVITANVFKVLV